MFILVCDRGVYRIDNNGQKNIQIREKLTQKEIKNRK